MAVLLKWQQVWTNSGGTEILAWTEVWGSDGVFNLSPSGPIAIVGTFSITAPSFKITTPKNLVQSGAIAVAGAIGVSGQIGQSLPTDVPFNIAQTGSIGIAGAVTTSGNLGYSKPYYFDPVGALPIRTITGVVSVSGNLGFTRPKNLQILAPIGLTGALGVTGNIGYTSNPTLVKNISQVGALAVTGVMQVSGNIAQGVRWALAPSAPIGITGALNIQGDINRNISFALVQSAPIGIVGTLRTFGNLQYSLPFNLSAQPIAITGQVGVAGNVTAPQSHYLVQSGAVGLTGVVAFTGDIGYRLFKEGLPDGWRIEQFLEEVPNPNFGTGYGHHFFRRLTWKGFDPDNIMVAASGSEEDCYAQTLPIVQSRYARWRDLA